MKRLVSILLGALLAIPAFSQPGDRESFKPRESWPFLYEEFMDGAARTRSGALVTEARFNIALQNSALLYIGKDGIIMKADMGSLYTARMGEDVFLNVSGHMYKLLSELDCGAVLMGTEIDVAEQSKVSIGYGISSSTASVQNMAILEDGRFDTTGKNYLQAERDKNSGEILPIKQTYYLYHQGILTPATKDGILDLPGVDKKEAKAFFKQEKIKWKDVPSLEKVLVYINNLSK